MNYGGLGIYMGDNSWYMQSVPLATSPKPLYGRYLFRRVKIIQL